MEKLVALVGSGGCGGVVVSGDGVINSNIQIEESSNIANIEPNYQHILDYN